VLFAAMLVLFWRYYEGLAIRMWLLPLAMFFWVNLHHGFVAGLALIGAYAFTEACDLAFTDRRAASWARLRKVAPWLGISVAATLLNPWGTGIFAALERQNKVTQPLTNFIGEWSGVHFNLLALWQALSPRDPASTDWWILGFAGITILICIWKKRPGPGILLAALLYESIQHLRFQAIFAVLVAVIGGSLLPHLAELFAGRLKNHSQEGRTAEWIAPREWVWGGAVVALFAMLAGVRSYDLISNRYYILSGQLSLFGPGESWWFPERAMGFLERERLPANLFHDYNLGGYLTWRVGEGYPDFADGRFIPFAGQLFDEQRELISASPDSPEWQKTADRWNINTIVLSISRYTGLSSVPLAEYCQSSAWKPVYLDEISILLVRDRRANGDAIRRLGIRCETAPIAPPKATIGNSWRARAERYEYLMNSASVYYVLSRDQEAAAALEQAEQLFPEDPNLHLVEAQFFAAKNHLEEAEREYLRVVGTSPSDAAWYALARLYLAERRYPEALHCVEKALPYSQVAYDRWRAIGVLYTYMNQPEDALGAFERAEKKSRYRGDSSGLGKEFNAQLAEGRARAYREMSNLNDAVSQLELALHLSPAHAAWWAELADLYQAQGQNAKAIEAKQKAESLQEQATGSKDPASAASSKQ
jgi:tetratricopeptide (TPR) repeat protein